MKNFTRDLPVLQLMTRVLILVTLIASTVVVVPLGSSVADAQAGEPLEVWGISGGIVSNPKQWKFTQSTSAGNDLGSAGAAADGVDTSSWSNVDLRWLTYPGPDVANHFRKDFTFAEIGVNRAQVVGIRVSLQYDDAAIMYLNGTEVYRTIRGNLPDFTEIPEGNDLPYDVDIPYGGFEEFYVDIPNVNGTNECEFSGPSCGASPYGGPNPPAIDPALLRDGVNTWSVTTWNQSGGGSGDSSLNHTFELIVDQTIVTSVVINEVMASNKTAHAWDLDPDDGVVDLKYPDWFELRNTSSSSVDLDGFTISDNSASWVFPPSTIIPANGHLVVLASDNDRTDTTPMQTNFKLSREGDSLRLVNPQGFVVDEVAALPRQFDDTSFGGVNDTSTFSYLASSTPGSTNSVAGNGYDPILRLFADRLYNVGESVNHQVDAFDPDGDDLSYSFTSLPPGLAMDSAGLITGTLTAAGTFVGDLRVTDTDNDFVEDEVTWYVIPAPVGAAPLVLNEYNAVRDTRELLGGSPLGNGGDWFEFVVVEDELDLRGYSIELWDLKGDDDQLRPAMVVTFGNDDRIGRAPAGTIITISEDTPQDLNFDAVSDWHINFQIDNFGNGTFFEPPDPAVFAFNSTRAGQAVLIRNAAGDVVAPVSGETEAWDEFAGGVSGGEVMSLCVDPTTGMSLNPLTDYQDVGAVSTFGEPNVCIYPEPGNPTNVITFNQSLNSIRSTATLGAGSGDTNCDLRWSVSDALAAAQFAVGNRDDSGPCFFDKGGPGFDMSADAADFTKNGRVSVQDALAIAQCAVGIPLIWCPE